MIQINAIHNGDCLALLKQIQDGTVHCCVTSPPYWGLRDYGVDGQIGLEKSPEEYVAQMVEVFREVKRVLRDDGTCWLNLGDSYYNYRGANNRRSDNLDNRETIQKSYHNITARPNEMMVDGLKQKDLVGIPWRVAFALQADGWYLRQDIIWHKPNPMPESITDRCTKSHEYIFLLAKSPKYYFDHIAIQEPAEIGSPNRIFGAKKQDGTMRNDVGRTWVDNGKKNKRSVWTVTTKPFKQAHFATFPPDLIEPCILAGCPEGGVVLDPFFGAGTTGVVAVRYGRRYIGLELNPDYCEIARKRLQKEQTLFETEAK